VGDTGAKVQSCGASAFAQATECIAGRTVLRLIDHRELDLRALEKAIEVEEAFRAESHLEYDRYLVRRRTVYPRVSQLMSFGC